MDLQKTVRSQTNKYIISTKNNEQRGDWFKLQRLFKAMYKINMPCMLNQKGKDDIK